MNKKSFLLALILFPLFLAALECSVCSRNIRGRYWKSSSGQVFCGRDCADSVLPVCTGCNSPCRNRVLSLAGKKFCSRNCMYATFRCEICNTGLDNMVTVTLPDGKRISLCKRCSNAPRCYFCSVPGCRDMLADGRHLCRSCLDGSVSDGEIYRVFRRVRADLVRRCGFEGSHPIELHLVDLPELEKLSGSIYSPVNGRRMSLMRFSRQIMVEKYRDGREKKAIKNEKCRIYVLNTFPLKYLEDAIAHELAHDHLRHRIGEVRNLADEEGFCEVVAAIWNESRGRGELNLRKEKNSDPVYGGGYRKMRQLYQVSGSLERLLRHIR